MIPPDQVPNDETDADEAIRSEHGAYSVLVYAGLIPCFFVMLLLSMALGEWHNWFGALFMLPFVGAALWPLFERWRAGFAARTPEGVRLSPIERSIAFAVAAALIVAMLFAPLL